MIPCKECITLASCRHKRYSKMVKDCSILYKILYKDPLIKSRIKSRRQSSFIQTIYEVQRILKPTVWTIRERHTTNGTYDLVYELVYDLVDIEQKESRS